MVFRKGIAGSMQRLGPHGQMRVEARAGQVDFGKHAPQQAAHDGDLLLFAALRAVLRHGAADVEHVAVAGDRHVRRRAEAGPKAVRVDAGRMAQTNAGLAQGPSRHADIGEAGAVR